MCSRQQANLMQRQMSVEQRGSRQEGRQAGCHGCVCMCLSPVRLDVHRHVNLTQLCRCACTCAHTLTHGCRRCNISYSRPGNTARWKCFNVRLIFFTFPSGSLLSFNSDSGRFCNPPSTPPPHLHPCFFFPSRACLIKSFLSLPQSPHVQSSYKATIF